MQHKPVNHNEDIDMIAVAVMVAILAYAVYLAVTS